VACGSTLDSFSLLIFFLFNNGACRYGIPAYTDIRLGDGAFSRQSAAQRDCVKWRAPLELNASLTVTDTCTLVKGMGGTALGAVMQSWGIRLWVAGFVLRSQALLWRNVVRMS
jgi:hypothetical protein